MSRGFARRLVGLAVFTTVMSAAPASAQDSAAQVEKLGKVNFTTSCRAAVQDEFNRAVALLHSFWFDASAKAFTAVATQEPACAMAHWGLAMVAPGNPFAWPPAPKALTDGAAALDKAKAAGAATPRERDYIGALEAFYKDHDKVDHRTRVLAYEKAMEQVAQRYPDDREAAVFYALALNAAALPTDKTYANQLKAAAILEKVFAEQPTHPGVAHYLIHSYDYPPIAARGLMAARRYAGIAPSAPHALHMPSHIFTRQGFWSESIESNRASAAAARNDFDRLHAMDYLMYAHLQGAQDGAAKRVLDEMAAISKVNVEHFVTAYALAAIPARYVLERGRWADAVALGPAPKDFPWSRFPQSEAVVHFARAIGATRSGDLASARDSVTRLQALRDVLAAAKSGYWAEQVDIQQRAAAGLIARAEARNGEALELVRSAAELESRTEKHPVTPGPIVPARELLAEMLLDLGQPQQALQEFETTLKVEPNRFRTLSGAARAAELAGDRAKAKAYYGQLLTLAQTADTDRPEIQQAKAFTAKN